MKFDLVLAPCHVNQAISSLEVIGGSDRSISSHWASPSWVQDTGCGCQASGFDTTSSVTVFSHGQRPFSSPILKVPSELGLEN
jgi:hypothetical protein